MTRAEQLRRLLDRERDPVKRWKLSPVDLASLSRWDEYTAAEETMFRRTHLPDPLIVGPPTAPRECGQGDPGLASSSGGAFDPITQNQHHGALNVRFASA